MDENQKQIETVREPTDRQMWNRPSWRKSEAKDAETGPNPTVEGGVLS